MIMSISFYLLFLLQLFSHQGMAADFHRTCHNINSTTCYPVPYENSVTGTVNSYCTTVALLNIIGPIWNTWMNRLIYLHGLSTQRAGDNANVEKRRAIEKEIGKLQNLFAQIVKDYDNGVNTDYDYYATNGMVAQLKENECETCSKDFIDIICKNETWDKGRNDNLKRLKAFSTGLTKCVDNNHKKFEHLPGRAAATEEGLYYTCRNFCYNVLDKVCNSWLHPLHYTSIFEHTAVLGLTAGLTVPVAQDTDNRAGSFLGDWANLMNTFFIPFGPFVTWFQMWRHISNQEVPNLINNIDKIFEENHYFLTLMSLTIGKIDNNLSAEQARGLIKMLVLVGWQQELAHQFSDIASQKAPKETRNEAIMDLRAKLIEQFKKNKVRYRDDDIDALMHESWKPGQPQEDSSPIIVETNDDDTKINMVETLKDM
jgi:hypothetical protein